MDLPNALSKILNDAIKGDLIAAALVGVAHAVAVGGAIGRHEATSLAMRVIEQLGCKYRSGSLEVRGADFESKLMNGEVLLFPQENRFVALGFAGEKLQRDAFLRALRRAMEKLTPGQVAEEQAKQLERLEQERRQLFVLVILTESTPAALALVYDLRRKVAARLREVDVETHSPPTGGSASGSGSGPAELPVIEYGITVKRERGKS